MTPKRIQLSRRKGWRMPPNTVKVVRPTMWGNPYKVGPGCTVKQAVQRFRQQLRRAIRAGEEPNQ